jgi:hypothetical protein
MEGGNTMTRDDIIRMAREAGFEEGYGNHLFPPGDYKEEVVPVTDEIIRFAALVAAAERESIAKMFDRNALYYLAGSEMRIVQTANAAAIRARGEV